MNARFWHYVNGDYVRITLRPGQELSWWSFQYTDDGWKREEETYYHTGDGVQFAYSSTERDCDGRTDRDWVSFCPLSELSARDNAESGAPGGTPEWHNVGQGQRDYAAEAAGY